MTTNPISTKPSRRERESRKTRAESLREDIAKLRAGQPPAADAATPRARTGRFATLAARRALGRLRKGSK
jgi:hypothetical protein